MGYGIPGIIISIIKNLFKIVKILNKGYNYIKNNKA